MHGHSNSGGKTEASATYRAWQSMKDRCDNSSSKNYSRYGGRGITYDQRWKDFETFLLDMGEKPESVDSFSLGRIDNNGNYTKDNCRWETAKQQASNTCRSKLTQEQADQIREWWAKKVYSQTEMARMFNTNQGHISNIIHRRRGLW